MNDEGTFTTAPGAIGPASLPRGTSIGRYTILRLVGRGSMGEVYAAFDPELDRKVALKLLRADPDAAREAGGASARLLREAKALARLSHRNVVGVHDVGTFDGRVFVAMDFVDGPTLGQWLAEGGHSRAEVLSVFTSAGRGLAAAHAVGLVHRDFKAGNVMITRDGSVRVLDFGLAHDVGGAPEADQLAFCVALQAALTGEKSAVPSWLRRVLSRGLSPAPDTRWPSMDALVAALASDPARASRRWAVGAGATLVVACAALTVARGARRPASLCQGGPARLAGAWQTAAAPAGRRADTRRAFLASGAPAAAEAWEHVAPVLDRYAGAWLASYRDACEATHVRDEQPTEILDLRMTCLDDRRASLTALTDVLAGADRIVVSKAVDAANALPPVAACADLDLLRTPVEPPHDEATRRKVDDVRKRMPAARAAHDTGHHQEALRIARALVVEARGIGYLPLLAETLGLLTDVHQGGVESPDTVPLIEEALRVSLAAGRDDLAARAAVARVGAIQMFGGNVETSAYWLGLGHALLDRASPKQELLRSWLLTNESSIRRVERRYEQGLALIREAIAIKEKVLPAGHPDIAVSLNDEAEALGDLGRTDEALRINDRVLQTFTAAYGPASSDVAYTLSNRGEYLIALGRAAEALELLRRGLALWEPHVDPDHEFLAYPLTAIGRALLDLGRAKEAIEPLERALRVRDVGDRQDALVALTRFALARALWDGGGDRATARRLGQRALDAYQRSRDGDGTATAQRWLDGHSVAPPTRGKRPTKTAP